ncbi:MAG TPA: hypothetical protein P5218_01165 [Planctomycetota bacterium]|nr:hypothetical protein [Planctomycetota bacterium]
MRHSLLYFVLAALVSMSLGFSQAIETQNVQLDLNSEAVSDFGFEVRVDGEWLAITDRGGIVDGTIQEGLVHVYRRGTDGWTPFQVLRSPQTGHGWWFGSSMALEGNQLLISCPRWGWVTPGAVRVPYSGSGRVFLFAFDGTQWGLTDTFRPTVPSYQYGDFYNAHFGAAVALRGDRIAISAATSAVPYPQGTEGVVYTYKRVNGVWEEDGTVVGPGVPDPRFPASFGAFGRSIDIEGDRLVVGAPADLSGMVSTWLRTPNGWEFEQVFLCPYPGIVGQQWSFGQSVSLDHNVLAIGMPRLSCWSTNCPSLVTIEELQHGVWQRTQVLSEVNSEPYGNRAQFGYELQLDGDWLVVGAPRMRWGGLNVNGYERGQIRLYKRLPGQGFVLQQRFHNEQLSFGPNATLGNSVSADFDRGLLVGGDSSFTYPLPPGPYNHGQGITLLFDMQLGDDLACPASYNTSGHHSHLSVVGSLNRLDNQLTLHATHLPPGQLAMFLYGSAGAPLPLPTGGQLCISGPVNRLQPAGIVGSTGERLLDIDFTVPREAANLIAGTTWAFQAWYRDYAFQSFTGTTNAVCVVLE